MPKNLLIFSDGTGQAGGILPDEKRSNIYKLFRATRCGPDTDIDPAQQLTFYDAGLGSEPAGGAFFITRAYRWLRKIASQATGLGITNNIVDCYAAILTMWEPGDRIFLFGFSRGAYTVRCLAAVLSFCGVPTVMRTARRPCFAISIPRSGSPGKRSKRSISTSVRQRTRSSWSNERLSHFAFVRNTAPMPRTAART